MTIEASDPSMGTPGDDRASLERDLPSYRAYLHAVARRVGLGGAAPAEESSDLVQAALAAAVSQVREGAIPGPDEGHRKAWLRKILLYVRNHRVRREAAQKRGGAVAIVPLDAPPPDPGTSPSGRAVRNESQARLAAVFETLPPGDQELIRWRFVEDMTCEEIARRRGWSASYASRECRRALEGLRGKYPVPSEGPGTP